MVPYLADTVHTYPAWLTWSAHLVENIHPLGKSHLGRGSVTRQGVSIFGPVIWEAAGLRGLQQTVLVGIWGQEPKV